MGDEKEDIGGGVDTWVSDKIVGVIERISKVAIEKLKEHGMSDEDLIFIPSDGKDPVLNPLLHALTLEFLQFEEFKIPKDNKCYLVSDETDVSDSLVKYESKYELAVSRVLSSPWASVSTIRGRNISATRISDNMINSGFVHNPDLIKGDSFTWSCNIFGGYGSSNENFDPVKTATDIFIKRAINGKFSEFNIILINNIPEREVGWKIILK